MSENTDGTRLSAEELTRIRQKHFRQTVVNDPKDKMPPYCGRDGSYWPCESAVLLSHIDSLAAENDALTARLALAEAVVEAARTFDIELPEWAAKYPPELVIVPAQVGPGDIDALRAALAAYEEVLPEGEGEEGAGAESEEAEDPEPTGDPQ